jgi:hypothetical protein
MRSQSHGDSAFRGTRRGPRHQWLAVRRLRELTTTARWRRRPHPGWGIVLHDGTVYGSTAPRPGLCLIARDGVLRTVLTVAVPAPRRAEP